MAKTVKIENIAEFRTVATEYGVPVPAKQGRPPAVKLAQAIVAKGDKITPTDYFDGRTEYKTVIQARNVGKSEWKLKGKRSGEKNGKKFTVPFSKVVAIGDVREFLSQTGDAGARGRISGEGFKAYLEHLFGEGVTVTVTSREKVGVAAVAPAAESDAKATPEPAEGENTDVA